MANRQTSTQSQVSLLNDPTRLEMVGEEEIMIDMYANSQNKSNFTFSTFKSSAPMKSSSAYNDHDTASKPNAKNKPQDKNTGGVVHLSTRIISDDVPPRDYQGLKSESVIFLPNATTLPNKKPAPVAPQKNNPEISTNGDHWISINGGGEHQRQPTTDLDSLIITNNIVNTISNEELYLSTDSLDKILKTKKSAAPPPPPLPTNPPPLLPPSQQPKISISAFERGRLPSFSEEKQNKLSPVEDAPSEQPTSLSSRLLSSLSQVTNPTKFVDVTPTPFKNYQRSNFLLGFPTIIRPRIEDEPTVSATSGEFSKNSSKLNVVLQAPKEFDDSIQNNQQMRRDNDHQTDPSSAQFSSNGASNGASTHVPIRPFRLKNAETSTAIRPVNFNADSGMSERDPTTTNHIYTAHPDKLQNDKIDGLKNTGLRENGESGVFPDSQDANDLNGSKDKNASKPSEHSAIAKSFEMTNGNGWKTDFREIQSKAMNESPDPNLPVTQLKFGQINPLTFTNKETTLPNVFTPSKNSTGVKPILDIPPNNYVNNKNFKNHLEGIIAKSATSTLKEKRASKPNRKQEGDQTDSKKPKYKFLVEGIDVPKGTFTGNQSESDTLENENVSTKAKKGPKGFSYIIDKNLAEQITKKAAEVTARKPHEFVESFTLEKEIISQSRSIDDNQIMREARLRLHAHLTGLKEIEADPDQRNFSETSDGRSSDRINSAKNVDIDQTGRISPGDRDVYSHRNGQSPKNESNGDIYFTSSSTNDWKMYLHESHSIPHDTSRIFLRPHDKDADQLKKLEEERYKSLRKRVNNNLSPRRNISANIFDDNNIEQNLSGSDISKSEQIITRRYRQSRKGSNSSAMSSKEAKIRNKAKNQSKNNNEKQSFNNSVNQPFPHEPQQSRPVKPAVDEQFVRENTGETSHMKPAVAQMLPNAYQLHHSSDDEREDVPASRTPFVDPRVSSRLSKQKKSRTKRDSNLKSEQQRSNLTGSSSDDEADGDLYIRYRGSKHNLKPRDKQFQLANTFDSEPEILDHRRQFVPGNVTVEIESAEPTKVNSVKIRDSNSSVVGNISLLKKSKTSRSSNKQTIITGEVTPIRKESRHRNRSKTLPNTGVSIVGPGVQFRPLQRRPSNLNSFQSFHSGNIASPETFRSRGNITIVDSAIELLPQVRGTSNSRSEKADLLRRKTVHKARTDPRPLISMEAGSVDPELEKVGKHGSQYRVQMKLNAVPVGRVSSLANNYIDQTDHRQLDTYQPIYNNSTVEYGRFDTTQRNVNSQPPNLVFSQNRSPSPLNMRNSSLSLLVTPNKNVIKTQINGTYSDSEDSYAIKSITSSAPPKNMIPATIEFDLELLQPSQPKIETYTLAAPHNSTNNDQSHQFEMSLNDTMRLEYEPPYVQDRHANVSSKRQRYQDDQTSESMLLMRDQIEGKDRSYSDGLPKIVRGSILIRNSLDKNKSRRYLDTIEENGSGGGQDNNLFHGRYFQRRENPMYASDLETMEYVRNEKRETKASEKNNTVDLPAVARDWDETDGHHRDVPILKEWYHDHIYGNRTRQNQSASRKTGAWKLKSAKNYDDVSENGEFVISSSTENRRSKNISSTSGQHIRQQIDVTREEEELIGPLKGESKEEVEANLNVDAISEKVELSLADGTVTIMVTVRCERLVPIRGTADMFRKSAVVVTRKIEIDMTVSPDKRAMYETAVALSKKQDTDDQILRLSTKDTFELYRKLMEMADQSDGPQEGLLFGSVHIDKELEEDKRLPYGAISPEILMTNDDLLSPPNSAYHRTRTRFVQRN